MSIDRSQGMTIGKFHEYLGAILTELPNRVDDPIMIKVGEEYFYINENLDFRKKATFSIVSSQLSAWKGEITRQMNKIQRILGGEE